MIQLKADLKGIPFFLLINGKDVIYERRNRRGSLIETAQWFPPIGKKVVSNIDPQEFLQWKFCKNEEDVYKMMKLDLMKNGCNIEEKRFNNIKERNAQFNKPEDKESIKDKEVEKIS